ncbi:MAG: hypothetical protein RIS80_1337 [Actinomycetota bacterium]
MSEEKNKKPAKAAKPARPAKAPKANADSLPNPVWFAPVMFGFMLLGLSAFPEANIGSWNIAIGFGLLMVGFGMATRWK